jgi:hypothetical protein
MMAPVGCCPTCRRQSRPDDCSYYSSDRLKLDCALSSMAYSCAPWSSIGLELWREIAPHFVPQDSTWQLLFHKKQEVEER